jgi:anti-anti-sigma regulatory factor
MNGQEPMLKITIRKTKTEELWILQGRLTEPSVTELKACWQRAHRAGPRRIRIVNLDDVTFIDRSGERLLGSMTRQGALCLGRDVYIQHVLDRLPGRPGKS